MDPKHYSYYTQIGQNIRYYRKNRNLSQEKLAEMSGHSYQHIQRVETARSVPSFSLLLDIARVLNIPVIKLLEIEK